MSAWYWQGSAADEGSAGEELQDPPRIGLDDGEAGDVAAMQAGCHPACTGQQVGVRRHALLGDHGREVGHLGRGALEKQDHALEDTS